MKEFKLNDVPENLQIRLYGVGDIKIYLNGKPVIDEFLRTKRHYDEINLSDYISVLKEGDNTIVMEIIDLKKMLNLILGCMRIKKEINVLGSSFYFLLNLIGFENYFKVIL